MEAMSSLVVIYAATSLAKNVNPSSFALRNELFHIKKKIEVELWLENNRSVDSLVSAYNESKEEIEEKEEEKEDDLEYFDTFPTIEELRIFLKKRRTLYLQILETALGIFRDGVAMPAIVIFDKEKPESSLDIIVDDSWMMI
ncbi:hypothetical protein Tco_0053289 [Tanacetum coccineum]